MICPNCGEPVSSRHDFCVVCGTDLACKGENHSRGGVKKPRNGTKAPAAEQSAAVTEPEKSVKPAENESRIMPDFMRGYI